jgi:hypothetical protein
MAGGGLTALLSLLGCANQTTSPRDVVHIQAPELVCSIPQDQIVGGGPGKDGIPALTNPSFVHVGDPGLEYLEDDDRVLGMLLEAGPIAIPLNILWWHEIVNIDAYGGEFAITHCPLTGSSLAFDRAVVGGAEFGVTGLLYKNNLIMYDRNDEESLWPQMARGARCGPSRDLSLPMVPVVEMTWGGWKELHPGTLVVSDDTGYSKSYHAYPYGGYEVLDNPSTFFPINLDRRRPPKERVLGLPHEQGALVFAYGLLDEIGPLAAVTVEYAGRDVVVFWDRWKEAAMAYEVVLDHEVLAFRGSNGRILDDKSGSVWTVDGRAVDGPLSGQRLQPVADAFIAYWFAWPEFYPEVVVWNHGASDSSPPEGL